MWPNTFEIFQGGAKLEDIKLNNSTIFGFGTIIIYQLILFKLMWYDLLQN